LIIFGNEKVGRLITEKGELEYRLVDIAILPEYRNLGIGTVLIMIFWSKLRLPEKY